MKSWMPAALACIALTGCYTYRPLEGVGAKLPAVGSKVEVALTQAGSMSFSQQVGPDVQYLLGQVVQADSSAVVLAMTATETTRRVSYPWKGEQVSIPYDKVASIRERKLSVGGSALLAGAAGGGLVAAFALLGGTSGSVGGGGGGGGGVGAQ
jgi:hypothetical protein